jgi:group I intron endonuclease
MTIYKITNLINNKIYIGQDSKDRENYLGSGKLIKYAVNKYGKENFKKEIIEFCNSKKELNEKEKYWIKKINSFAPIGYNIGTGGEGQDNFTYHPEKERLNQILIKARKKAKIKNIGNKNMLGKHHTEKTKIRISNFFKGKKLGDENPAKRLEVREKIRLSHLGSKNANYGKPRSEETKRKIGEANKGKIVTKEQIEKARKTREERGISFKGANHPSAKTFILYSPCGIKHIITGWLRQFCKEQNLSSITIYRHLKKDIHTYRGWTIYRQEKVTT